MSYDESPGKRPTVLTRNQFRNEEQRWVRTRKAFNTKLHLGERLLAHMTKRQGKQLQIQAGLVDPKDGQVLGPFWKSVTQKGTYSGGKQRRPGPWIDHRYVGGRAMTLLAVSVLASTSPKGA